MDKYDINIELNLDDEYNALIYDDKCLIESHKIFTQFFGRLDYLKNKYPDNKLVKHIFSSSWGEISKFNEIYKTKEEVKEEQLIFVDSVDFMNGDCDDEATHIFIDHEVLSNGKEIFTLIPLNENPYKKQFKNKTIFNCFWKE
jgi:hypothetical protein